MTLYNLGTNIGNTVIQRDNFTVTTAEPNDIFKFTTNSNRSINLLLKDVTADVDLKLYLDNGNGTLQMSGPNRDTLISTSDSGGSVDDHINRWRGAGTYFAVVEQYSSSSPITYDLYVAASTQSSSLTGPPNTLPRENSLGTLSGDRTFTGRSVGFRTNSGTDGFSLNETGDTSDLYYFTLPSGRTVDMILNGLSADADIRLIRDADNDRIVDAGEQVDDSTNTGTTQDSIFLNTAGTYYLQVYPFAQTPVDISYNLTFNYT